MKEVVVRKFKIKDIWKNCELGLFAIPEIQREFVWNLKRCSNLLDSIYRRFPIGNFIIWETGSDQRNLLRHAQEILPPYNIQNKKIWFLIDGQQRLSVLYHAKKGDLVKDSNGKIIDFSNLYFSLDTSAENKFLFTRRRLEKNHVPLADILSDKWQRKVKYISKNKKAQVSKCRSLIINYEVPVIFVKTKELDEVRETFLRINSGGLRISEADKAFTRASKLNLRRLVTELRNSLPHGFNKIRPQIIQSAMALIYEKKELGSSAVERAISDIERDEIVGGTVSKAFNKKWKAICKSIKMAVDYLHNELGVSNYSFLPSDNMLATLSYFFYSNNGAQPNSKQRKEIRKWFWATAVGRRYVGRGYYQNIQRDLELFNRLARKKIARFIFNELVPEDDLRRTEYIRSGGLTSAFFLMLIRKKPRYLESGSFMPLDKTAYLGNRKDKHHIFPRSILDKYGFSKKEANSLCNICYLVAEDNQSIGNTRPSDYFLWWKNKKHFAAVMRSHLIPYRRNSPIWDSNIKRAYRLFIRARLQEIKRQLEKEAGIRLFRKD